MADVKNATATAETQATTNESSVVTEQDSSVATTAKANVAKDTVQEDSNNEPDKQELLNEIARLKRKADKDSADAAEWKRKYRETLSEKEVLDQDKAEKEARREEEYQTLLRENRINKLEKTYLGLAFTADEASRMAIAEVDDDFEMKAKIMSEVDARKKKEYEIEFLKSRPPVNAGSGANSLSKEEIMAIKDPAERQRAIAQNLTAFA